MGEELGVTVELILNLETNKITSSEPDERAAGVARFALPRLEFDPVGSRLEFDPVGSRN